MAFCKTKAEAKQTLLRRGGGWIRFSAEKPRRLKRATGAFPRAAFRIHNKKRPTCWRDVCWWRRVDSNHRSESQQIYSLPPLATRELLHMKLWSWWTDSNPRPADYKSAALPAELHQPVVDDAYYYTTDSGICQRVWKSFSPSPGGAGQAAGDGPARLPGTVTSGYRRRRRGFPR